MCGRKQLIIETPSPLHPPPRQNAIQCQYKCQVTCKLTERTSPGHDKRKHKQRQPSGRQEGGGGREERQSDVQHMNCISCSVRLQGERGFRPGNLTFYFVHFVFRQCGKEFPLQICLGVLHYANIATARLLHCPCA